MAAVAYPRPTPLPHPTRLPRQPRAGLVTADRLSRATSAVPRVTIGRG